MLLILLEHSSSRFLSLSTPEIKNGPLLLLDMSTLFFIEKKIRNDDIYTQMISMYGTVVVDNNRQYNYNTVSVNIHLFSVIIPFV